MRYLYFLPFLLLFHACNDRPAPAEASSSRPNIVLVITDDQGYGDLGFHGNPDIRTPVLDGLARESTRFTQFYVSPVCAPTRANLMTGRYSLRTGVYDTYNGGAMMSGEERTIAELLREQGYATGMFGKWHLGDNYPSRPHDQGFEQSLYHRSGGMAQVGDVTTWFQGDSAYFDPVLLTNGEEVKKQGYCSDIFTDAAIEFMEEQKDNPFFVYLSFNAPHTPLQLPGEYEAMYADLEIDSTKYPPSERPFPVMNERNIRDARRVYGMVTNIDDNMGRLLAKLDELELTEETLVIFITDNGPQQPRYVGGFRGRKGSVYEGGVRVPCFMRLPAQFPNDKDIPTPAAHLDILPTLLELVGAPTPRNLDGHSLLPLIRDEAVDWADRALYFHWIRGFPEPHRNTAVRRGDYKLVGLAGYNATDEELELYNLAEDPGEMHNLSRERPELIDSLRQDFEQWYNDIVKNSEHLGEVRIVLGAEEENPSILNRNDASGSFGIWAEEEVYGYWDVEVAEPGRYNIRCFFREPLSAPGQMTIRLGRVQRSVRGEAGPQEIILPNIELPAGPARLEAVYREGQGQRRKLFPFFVEVERVE